MSQATQERFEDSRYVLEGQDKQSVANVPLQVRQSEWQGLHWVPEIKYLSMLQATQERFEDSRYLPDGQVKQFVASVPSQVKQLASQAVQFVPADMKNPLTLQVTQDVLLVRK